MISQEILEDNSTAVNDFIERLVQKYDLKSTPNRELKYRSVNRDLGPTQVVTDNQIIELILNNRLLGLVYLRRTDLNFTEATFVEIEPNIK